MMALLPRKSGDRMAVIAMVLSVWISTKKPRLATSTAPLNHCVAVRICVMEPSTSDVSGKTFRCNACSPAWVIKPESITAVMAYDNCGNQTEFCEISLTDESMTLMESLR